MFSEFHITVIIIILIIVCFSFQISEPRKEIRRYDGEISGIKVNLSKSIKIKA